MSKSITLRASFRTKDDEVTFELLQRYCHRMGISLSLVRINDSLVLTFTAPEQQLTELEDHLREVGRVNE